MQLAAVTYKGDGKYDPAVDFAVSVHTMQLIDPSDPPKELELPPGRSWWPVCTVSWKSEANDNWFCDSAEEYARLQQAGAMAVFAVCWY